MVYFIGILFTLLGGVLYALYGTGLGGNRLKNIDPTLIIDYVLIFPIFFNVSRCFLGEPLISSGETQIIAVLLLAVFSTFLARIRKGTVYKGLGLQ